MGEREGGRWENETQKLGGRRAAGAPDFGRRVGASCQVDALAREAAGWVGRRRMGLWATGARLQCNRWEIER